MDILAQIKSLGACPDAVSWLQQNSYNTPFSLWRECPKNPDKSPFFLWKECPRGDWLLWLFSKSREFNRQLQVKAGCACARLVLKNIIPYDGYSLLAIEAAETWANDPCEKNRYAAEIAMQNVRSSMVSFRSSQKSSAEYAQMAVEDITWHAAKATEGELKFSRGSDIPLPVRVRLQQSGFSPSQMSNIIVARASAMDSPWYVVESAKLAAYAAAWSTAASCRVATKVDAFDSEAEAAGIAASAAAETAAHKKCADIVRSFIPFELYKF